MRPFKRRVAPDRLPRRDDSGQALLEALHLHPHDLQPNAGAVLDLGARRRTEAARLLVDVPGEATVAGLLESLADPDPVVRRAALESLVARPDSAEARLLAGVLAWPEPKETAKGMELLAERAAIDDQAAARLLSAYVECQVPEARLPGVIWLVSVISHVAPPELARIHERAVTRALESPDGAAAARQLLIIEAQASVAALHQVADRAETRAQLATLLGELRDSNGSARLIELLGDSAPETRQAAAEALGRVQDPSTVEALLACSGDPEFRVRDAAQRALDAFGAGGAVWAVLVAARNGFTGAAELIAHTREPRGAPLPQLEIGNPDGAVGEEG